MLRPLANIVLLSLTLSTFAQQKKTYFSDAISLHIDKYKEKCQEAIWFGDYDRIQVLFDSLIEDHLKGTLVEDLEINRYDGEILKTKELEKPFILLTTATWYIKGDEEIEAINTLACEFADKVHLIVLYWDSKKNLKKLAKRYDENVILAYVDETSNKESGIVKPYKHALGVPAVFYVDAEKSIVDIDRGGSVTLSVEQPDQELYATNYEIYHRNMIKLLLLDGLSDNTNLSDNND